MRRIGDWINIYGALCALVWAGGAAVIGMGAPPLNPTREKLCALYAPALPEQDQSLPPQIGALAQYGAPHWGTWMPAFTPVDPAPIDPYPACLHHDFAFQQAQKAHQTTWRAWWGAHQGQIMLWAGGPLALAPLVLLAAMAFTRRPAKAHAPQRPQAAARLPAAPPPSATAQSQVRRPLAPNAPPLRAQLRRENPGVSASGSFRAAPSGSLPKRKT